MKNVVFSIANYWMQIFPLFKKIISHIDNMCRNFLWSGKECFTRKAPIPWDHISDPVSADGLNLIYLKDWNKTTIGKLLWNVFVKKDRLWINWVHLYYLEKKDVATYIPKVHYSWIIKAMFKHKITS